VSVVGDPFLNYFGLGVLVFVVVVLFYGIIAIHDIPHIVAKSRNHPHQDAIHAAGWVSLFTLHALWPFLWIWAMAYRPERGWGFSKAPNGDPERPTLANELAELRRRIASLEGQFNTESKSRRETTPETEIRTKNLAEVGGG
jgi:hypothetical protein